MIRIYFVYKDPLDETGVNLSFADVPTSDPTAAFLRIEDAAESGELWKRMYPRDEDRPYTLLKTHMMYLDISALPIPQRANTILPPKERVRVAGRARLSHRRRRIR